MPIIEKKLYKQATPNGIQVEYLVRRTVEPGGDVRIHLDATILESGGRWALGHVSLPVSVWESVLKDFPVAADSQQPFDEAAYSAGESSMWADVVFAFDHVLDMDIGQHVSGPTSLCEYLKERLVPITADSEAELRERLTSTLVVQTPTIIEPKTATTRYTVGVLHGTPVVWEMNECDGEPDPRPLSLARIAEMLNER